MKSTSFVGVEMAEDLFLFWGLKRHIEDDPNTNRLPNIFLYRNFGVFSVNEFPDGSLGRPRFYQNIKEELLFFELSM